jgi:hypothetical protein
MFSVIQTIRGYYTTVNQEIQLAHQSLSFLMEHYRSVLNSMIFVFIFLAI